MRPVDDTVVTSTGADDVTRATLPNAAASAQDGEQPTLVADLNDPLARTIKTPPQGIDMTLATQAGFDADVTAATQAASGAAPAGAASSSDGPAPGVVWGDYEFGKLLGRGGMGSVYLATQRSLDRPVAIKVLPQHLGGNEDFRRRFVLEARSVAQIASPHVIQVFAAGEHEGSLFFAMEYVAGKDLSERVKSGFRPTVNQALDLVLQAARGLAAAGDCGIVHRDIKPSNMMVTEDLRLKIMDFGLVKMTKSEHGLTMAGTVMGTVTYFSPEQGRGDDIDHRTDIYALGVVFYELLTGRLPFTGDDPSAIIYQHLHAEPKPPKEINPSIPERFQAVVLKCMQKEKEDRYPNAHELIADLDAILEGREPATALLHPSQLRTGATIVKTNEFKREKKKSSGLGFVVSLAAVAAVAVGGWVAYNRYGSQWFGDPGAATVTDTGLSSGSLDTTELERAQRLLSEGDFAALEAMLAKQRAAGDLGPAWQGIARDAALAQGEVLVAEVRDTIASGDAVEAASALERLAAFDADHAAIVELRGQIEALQQARGVMASARAALADGRPQDAMTALAGVNVAGLPDTERDRLETLTQDARAVGQLLSTASDALARDDLDTARQSFFDAFERFENAAAGEGLKAVGLCKQIGEAISAGDLAKARRQIDELAAITRFGDLAGPRQARIRSAELVQAVERALTSQDFAAAEAALQDLRATEASNPQIERLEHQVALERQVLRFDRALRDKDLVAARAALEAIKAHDGERLPWQRASERLAASRLEQNAKAARLAEREQAVRDVLAAPEPDFMAADKALAAFAELAGAETPQVAALRAEIHGRRAELAVASSLRLLDAAILAGERDKIAALVSDAAHAKAIDGLIGQDGLAIEHQVQGIALDGDAASVEVLVQVAMTVAPEAMLNYRYQMERGPAGWRIIGVERLSK